MSSGFSETCPCFANFKISSLFFDAARRRNNDVFFVFLTPWLTNFQLGFVSRRNSFLIYHQF